LTIGRLAAKLQDRVGSSRLEFLKRNSDYAIRALVYLAQAERGTLVSARAISEAQEVPEALLRKLLQQLCRAGIVASEQGTHGGFRLAKPPDSISLLDIVETVQGQVAVNRCYMRTKTCPRQRRCKITGKLTETQKRLVECFRAVAVADLASLNGSSRSPDPSSDDT